MTLAGQNGLKHRRDTGCWTGNGRYLYLYFARERPIQVRLVPGMRLLVGWRGTIRQPTGHCPHSAAEQIQDFPPFTGALCAVA